MVARGGGQSREQKSEREGEGQLRADEGRGEGGEAGREGGDPDQVHARLHVRGQTEESSDNGEE